MRELAELFKALSDETRLQILALILSQGKTCVCDVEEVLGITQSKASRHLRHLRAAGLLTDRREAVWVHYAVPAELDADRARLLETVRALLSPARLGDLQARLRDWQNTKPETGACRVG